MMPDLPDAVAVVFARERLELTSDGQQARMLNVLNAARGRCGPGGRRAHSWLFAGRETWSSPVISRGTAL